MEEEEVMEEVKVEAMVPQALGLGPDWALLHKGLGTHKDLLVVVMGMGLHKDL